MKNKTAFNIYAGILAGFGISPMMEGMAQSVETFAGHGVATAYNASQFAGANFHEALTNFAARQVDPAQADLDAHARFLAPEVYSGSGIAEWGTFANVDAFMALDDVNGDIRAIGADFTTLQNPPRGIAEQRIPNRGLAIDVDEDSEPKGSNWEQAKVTHILGILARNRIRRAVALLVASGTAVALTWDTTAGKDPDSDLAAQLDLAAATLGFRPNRVAFDALAWSYRKRSHRAQNTAGGTASAMLDEAGLSTELGAEARQIAGRYATSASARTSLLGAGKVLIFSGSENPGLEDMSSLKTFWAPTLSGGRFRVIKRQVGDKKWRIAVESNEVTTVLSTNGIRVLAISNA